VPFLLAVVAVVGEVAEEVERLHHGDGVELFAGVAAVGQLLQAVQHLFDDPVLVHQDVDRFHGGYSDRLPRGQALAQ
jgi:hypothetical protein